jgi:hypothetical protein
MDDFRQTAGSGSGGHDDCELNGAPTSGEIGSTHAALDDAVFKVAACSWIWGYQIAPAVGETVDS